jgi:hypothetical protein
MEEKGIPSLRWCRLGGGKGCRSLCVVILWVLGCVREFSQPYESFVLVES